MVVPWKQWSLHIGGVVNTRKQIIIPPLLIMRKPTRLSKSHRYYNEINMIAQPQRLKEHLHETTVSQFNIAENVADLYKEKQVGTFISVFVFVFVQGVAGRNICIFCNCTCISFSICTRRSRCRELIERKWSMSMIDQHFKKMIDQLF